VLPLFIYTLTGSRAFSGPVSSGSEFPEFFCRPACLPASYHTTRNFHPKPKKVTVTIGKIPYKKVTVTNMKPFAFTRKSAPPYYPHFCSPPLTTFFLPPCSPCPPWLKILPLSYHPPLCIFTKKVTVTIGDFPYKKVTVTKGTPLFSNFMVGL
jgi:hypothetical protein